MFDTKKHRKGWYKRLLIYIVGAILLCLLLYFTIQGVRCASAVKAARENLESYGAETAKLSYGNMNYVDKGKGEVILSVHGIFGGYDQALILVMNLEINTGYLLRQDLVISAVICPRRQRLSNKLSHMWSCRRTVSTMYSCNF